MGQSFLQILQHEDIEAIHAATLRILGEVGIILSQPDALELLLGAGARLKNSRILLPESLVEWALAQCPHIVSLGGVKPSHSPRRRIAALAQPGRGARRL